MIRCTLTNFVEPEHNGDALESSGAGRGNPSNSQAHKRQLSGAFSLPDDSQWRLGRGILRDGRYPVNRFSTPVQAVSNRRGKRSDGSNNTQESIMKTPSNTGDCPISNTIKQSSLLKVGTARIDLWQISAEFPPGSELQRLGIEAFMALSRLEQTMVQIMEGRQ